MIKIKKLKNSDDAVTGLVVAILLLGLFITMLAFVQGVYVPQWMEQKEAEHMEQVATQLDQLKYVVDNLILNERQNYPISSPITLGSKEMPFLSSTRAYGVLDFSNDDCKVKLLDFANREIIYTLGSLIYSSDNAYFLNQEYIFENGAMILSQSSGDFISVSPFFSVVDNDHIVVNLIKFVGVNGKTSASGYGTYPVQAKFIETNKVSLDGTHTLIIYTDHPEAWKQYFDDLRTGLTKNYVTSSTEYYSDIDGSGIKLVVETGISPQQVNYLLIEAYITTIELQISPGWVNQ